MTFQSFANIVLRSLMKLLLDYQAEGMQNIPDEGPVIAIQNHMISIDTVIGAALVDRQIMGMSKAENYDNAIVALFFRLYGTFPIRRGEVDRQALRTSLRVLKEGKVLMAAPEGTRSHTNSLQRGKDGLSYIAVKSGAPIVPIAIWGAEDFWRQLRRLRRTKVHVRFGEPFYLDPRPGKLSREDLAQMTDEMMYQLAALLPPQYRGYYSDLGEASQRHIRPYDGRRGGSKNARHGGRGTLFSKGSVRG
jgi:1-acyl-sn-glycerol-3-phosphate acyltransferase